MISLLVVLLLSCTSDFPGFFIQWFCNFVIEKTQACTVCVQKQGTTRSLPVCFWAMGRQQLWLAISPGLEAPGTPCSEGWIRLPCTGIRKPFLSPRERPWYTWRLVTWADILPAVCCGQRALLTADGSMGSRPVFLITPEMSFGGWKEAKRRSTWFSPY